MLYENQAQWTNGFHADSFKYRILNYVSNGQVNLKVLKSYTNYPCCLFNSVYYLNIAT